MYSEKIKTLFVSLSAPRPTKFQDVHDYEDPKR